MNTNLAFPLRSWTLRDFKSVGDATIELAPLTVLVGANSAGKSSVMHSMLMVAQAAAVPPHGGGFPLNGPLVELGEFADVRRVGGVRSARVAVGCAVVPDGGMAHAGGPPPQAPIRWNLELSGGKNQPGEAAVRCVNLEAFGFDGEALVLGADRLGRRAVDGGSVSAVRSSSAFLPLAGGLKTIGPGGPETLLKTSGLTHRGGIPSVLFAKADENIARVEAWVRRVRRGLVDQRQSGETEWDRIRSASGVDGNSVTVVTDDPQTIERAVAACDLLIEMIVDGVGSPEGGGYPAGTMSARLAATLADLRREARRSGFQDVLRRLIDDGEFVEEILRRVGGGEQVARPAADDTQVGAVVRRMEAAGCWLADFMAGRVVHLGPLRQDPQLRYPATPAGPRGSVGAKGEYALAVLHQYARRTVLCPLQSGGAGREMTLEDAVNYWLEQLGLGCSVATVQRPRHGLEPQVRMEMVGRDLSMTGVGVGVSQVLPVLVLSLIADPGTVLLLEQPELHLHPGVQQRLGDFLLAVVNSGRQVVVETHSDHLVTRLRRRMAEDHTDKLHLSVAIVFAEREGGQTRFKTLESNRYGGLEEWPSGFFDGGSGDARALVEAAMSKKK